MAARPTTIDTEHLVEVARRLFLEHGVGVSTAVIARELGISEGSIYKRFPTKDALFRAALGLPDCAFVDDWPEQVGQGEPRDNLCTMGLQLIDFFRELIPRVVMVCSQPGGDPVQGLRECEDPPPVRILGALTEYLEGEMARGRVARRDAMVVARMLVGPLHNFAFFEVVGFQELPATDAETMVRDLVDVLWQGVAP